MRFRFGSSFSIVAVLVGAHFLDIARSGNWPDLRAPRTWLEAAFVTLVALWAMRIDAKKKSTADSSRPTRQR